MLKKRPLDPFLKWPGGKRWLAGKVTDLARQHLTGTYFEPFLGGGALFFYWRPERAVLSDINGPLINAYRQVKRSPDQIREFLREMPVGRGIYYSIRGLSLEDEVDQAVRFLYLNRTCFSGLYRVNKKGQFTVPYGGGRTPRLLTETQILNDAAAALRGAELLQSDFESVVQRTGEGDVVYCDPPYAAKQPSTNGFRRYNDQLFSWSDQQRLAAAVKEARNRGATVIVSNSADEVVGTLYEDAECLTLERSSRVSSDPASRGAVMERVFVLRGNA